MPGVKPMWKMTEFYQWMGDTDITHIYIYMVNSL